MHDTNERYLFVKDYRALSHGCVRLSKPFDLLDTFAEIEPKDRCMKKLKNDFG